MGAGLVHKDKEYNELPRLWKHPVSLQIKLIAFQKRKKKEGRMEGQKDRQEEKLIQCRENYSLLFLSVT